MEADLILCREYRLSISDTYRKQSLILLKQLLFTVNLGLEISNLWLGIHGNLLKHFLGFAKVHFQKY